MPRTAGWWSKECLSRHAKSDAKCAVSMRSCRRSRADVRVSPPLLSSSPLSSRLLSSPPCAPPLLDAAPLLEMPISFSTAAARVSSTLLPPLVDAAPHRVAPLLAATPLVTPTPLSPHSSPPHLSSDLSSMPRLLCVVPLLSSTPLLSSMPRLLAAATSSDRPASPPAPLVPLHMYTCFSSVCRGTVCVRRTMRKRFAVHVS